MDAATAVVLLCRGEETDEHLHWVHFAVRCHRITPQELEDHFYLSQVRLQFRRVGHGDAGTTGLTYMCTHTFVKPSHPQGGVTDALIPDTHAHLVRNKPHERLHSENENFRAAIAYGLALHRMVPEPRRCVTIDARMQNNTSVYLFPDEQRDNPLQSEVRRLKLSTGICQSIIGASLDSKSLHV